MSAVDVLETVRQLAALARSEYEGKNGDLSGTDLIARGERAVAAVAELIEAARAVNRAADWCTGDGSVFDRLNSALRNVEGKP